MKSHDSWYLEYSNGRLDFEHLVSAIQADARAELEREIEGHRSLEAELSGILEAERDKVKELESTIERADEWRKMSEHEMALMEAKVKKLVEALEKIASRGDMTARNALAAVRSE